MYAESCSFFDVVFWIIIQRRSVEVSRSAVGLLRAQQARLSAHAKLKGALSGKAEADGSYLAALQVQVESALQGNPAVIIGLATASGAIPQLAE